MYFDIFLLSVILATVYLGPVIVRRHPPGERMFGWLLIADGAAALLSFIGRHSGSGDEAGASGTADLLGFVAIAAAICLIMVPPLLRDLARRAVMSDRLRLARRLVELRSHLQPGMGAERERELLDALIAVRSGHVDDAVAALEDTRQTLSDAQAVRQIDERIVFTYLSARRFGDAIRAYETRIGAVTSPGPGPGPGPGSTSPQLMVEMVRAYCETGDLEKAAILLTHIESLPLGEEPLFLLLVYRARLMFLAFVGRVAAVEGLLASSGPLGILPPATRQYWCAIAHLHAGDRAAARARLEEAMRLSRHDRMAREFARNLLDSLAAVGEGAAPRQRSPEVEELADRLAAETSRAEPLPVKTVPALGGVTPGRVPMTLGLLVANLVAFALVLVFYGSTGDPGALVRAGANIKSAVRVGELWRVATAMFLHIGFVHLLLNMYALWILGKLVEQMYGPARMFVLYMAAGLCGGAASVLFGGPGISAGASGAVLGLLGALIAELGLRRHAYPDRWRKLLLGNLVFVAMAQVAIGFYYQAIDQSAHLGGLLAGALLAATLSPRRAGGRSLPVRGLVGALLGASLAMLGYGVFGVATTDYGDTLARYGETEHRVDHDLAFMGPTHWETVDHGRFRDVEVVRLAIQAVPRDGKELETVLEERIQAETYDSRTRRRPDDRRLAVPAPWQSHELTYWEDGMGGEQTYRMIVFGRAHESEHWIGILIVPDALARDIQPTLARVMNTMRRL